MSKIAIISDTDASLPAEIAARHNIQLVPITIHFGEESFLTDDDINDEQLFDRVDRDGVLPTTSAPSPGAFSEAYEAAFAAGAESVICLNVSAEISATYAAAVAARDMHPQRDITVIDSRSLSMAQGFAVLAAAEAAESGASKEEIIAAATQVRDRAYMYAALSTLKYLAMSGRVGHLAAGMANLFNVKPILTIQNGKLELLERVRTQRKATARVVELLSECTGGRRIERLAIIHVRALEDALRFKEQLCAEVGCPDEIIVTELTPGLSVHSGAGLVGACCVVEAEVPA
jgi:DegV family protein with EDD domain